ncbi:MAG: hypothetical protein HXS41_11435 [Theionarchaea archaeon]|nr:hypothetical protein [Theionarchaea archaeon]MBU7000042.1 hypothetical protein [Theionarchaea archaeon]MBU7021660.1 hypothetical protein [Theionarchaea archaeon]MBU7034693.1 hypothetical protein [Theionarchaea archaeon]MBU7039353.1 hypothetical protein [Theionarchaea archaeon]
MEDMENNLEYKADTKDVIAFTIALWQIFLPYILVLVFLFVVAVIFSLLV